MRLLTVSDDDSRTALPAGLEAAQTGQPDGYRERVAAMRRRYGLAGLSESDLAATWLDQFATWFAAAAESGLVVEPNAMLLATATPDGRPGGRTVLLKGYDERGFGFFTNYLSRKGRELAANPRAALVFPWYPLERQVVVDGRVVPVTREETARYFAIRPRGAQLGAWASPQSTVVAGRAELAGRLAEASDRWPDGTEIPPPEHWGGFRVEPETVEFWQGRPDRLHDRLRYRRLPSGDWVVERLAP